MHGSLRFSNFSSCSPYRLPLTKQSFGLRLFKYMNRRYNLSLIIVILELNFILSCRSRIFVLIYRSIDTKGQHLHGWKLLPVYPYAVPYLRWRSDDNCVIKASCSRIKRQNISMGWNFRQLANLCNWRYRDNIFRWHQIFSTNSYWIQPFRFSS